MTIYFLSYEINLYFPGVFILLLLSGERNFGVRLNKPYTAAVPMDISVFSGSHADLLIIVFHKVKKLFSQIVIEYNFVSLDNNHRPPKIAASV